MLRDDSLMLKTIYLAGGCFWGVEKYLAALPGVVATQVGYANGLGEYPAPTYEEVCSGATGCAETVEVVYDPEQISLSFLLDRYFVLIDPTSLNRQGPDRGTQYRTGIYYVDGEDEAIIRGALQLLQESCADPVVVEVEPLRSFTRAEEYHQHYLDTNPGGYCHLDPVQLRASAQSADMLTIGRDPDKSALRERLTPLQFEVTQNNATEPPFANEYCDVYEPGIYVDITTGTPLFVSTDKFESGCGWPSFSKPISDGVIAELPDHSHGRQRVEVRSREGDAHLGHVFEDGPSESGGLRYCINSASLRFVPLDQMEREGYGDLVPLVR